MPRSSIQQRVVAGEMMSDMRCGAPQRRATLRTMSPPGIFERSSRTAHILYSEASSVCCALDKREISLSFYFAVLQLVRSWFALSAFGVLSKSLCLATSQQVRTNPCSVSITFVGGFFVCELRFHRGCRTCAELYNTHRWRFCVRSGACVARTAC